MDTICPLCRRNFSRKDSLQRHIRNTHEKKNRTNEQTLPPRAFFQTIRPEEPLPPSTVYQTRKPDEPLLPRAYYQEMKPKEPLLPRAYYQELKPDAPSPIPISPDRSFVIYKTDDPMIWTVPIGHLDDHYMPWAHPFTSVIAGPTGSGKTVFARRFVQNIKHMMMPEPDRITWCYDVYQPIYATIEGVEFVQGLPDLDALDPRQKRLIIVDDQMDDVNQKVADLFTKYSHHKNTSVMLIVQNLFNKNKHHRTISLNTHYMVLFKNPRDVSQMMALGHQMYPRQMKYFTESYVDATSKPHGYLLIDMKQTTPELLRLRGDIFPGEKTVVFIPK